MDSKITPGFPNCTWIPKTSAGFPNHPWVPKPLLHSCPAQLPGAVALCLSKKRGTSCSGIGMKSPAAGGSRREFGAFPSVLFQALLSHSRLPQLGSVGAEPQERRQFTFNLPSITLNSPNDSPPLKELSGWGAAVPHSNPATSATSHGHYLLIQSVIKIQFDDLEQPLGFTFPFLGSLNHTLGTLNDPLGNGRRILTFPRKNPAHDANSHVRSGSRNDWDSSDV